MVGQPEVIAVEEGDVVSRHVVEPGVAGGVRALIGLPHDADRACHPSSQAIEDLARLVRAPIVNDDDLPPRVGLCGDGGKSLAEHSGTVVGRKNDADETGLMGLARRRHAAACLLSGD